MKKKSEVRFYLTTELYDAVKKVSSAHGQPVSSFARHIFSSAFVRFCNEQGFKELLPDFDESN